MPEVRINVAGIAISHPERMVYPEAGITKGQVAEYYAAMADPILKVAANRPLSLLRLTEGLLGERFFQKHAGKGFPDGLRSVTVREKDGDDAEYMYVSDASGLVGLVTGGKGVHVVVPLRRVAEWDRIELFSRVLATHLAETRPRQFTATMSKSQRKGLIFIDWLRNQRGATAIAPFSLRARPGAPVAVPVSYDELATLRKANAFGIKQARNRTWNDLDLPDPVGLTQGRIARLDKMVSRAR